MNYPEIKHLANNPTMEGQVKLISKIIYSTATEKKLALSLLLPWNVDDDTIENEKKPLIVFIQGSAWCTPDREFEIPQLSAFARKGYVVASVGHRNTLLGYPFPAYLEDVKCAIRFLRKNADIYGIDSERIAIWGTSSGGNAAMLAGLTGDDPRYKTEEYGEYSDKVKLVVECFGPTDLSAMGEIMKEQFDTGIAEMSSIAVALCGGDLSRYEEVAKAMSPIQYVEEGKNDPPFLLIHGNNDSVVPYDQMVSLYHKMIDCGYDVEAWQVDGAVHEGNFWSDAVYQVILEFIEKHI